MQSANQKQFHFPAVMIFDSRMMRNTFVSLCRPTVAMVNQHALRTTATRLPVNFSEKIETLC